MAEQIELKDVLQCPCMLTTKSQKNRPAAEQYFDEHLTHNDYYSQGDIRPGLWIGQKLDRFDLKEGEAVEPGSVPGIL